MNEISKMRTQLNEMDEELEQYVSHVTLELMANDLNLKIHGILETQKQVSRKKLLDCAIDKFKDQLRDLEHLVRHEPSCSKTLLLRRVAKLHRGIIWTENVTMTMM